jgi:hypothetical protein
MILATRGPLELRISTVRSFPAEMASGLCPSGLRSIKDVRTFLSCTSTSLCGYIEHNGPNLFNRQRWPKRLKWRIEKMATTKKATTKKAAAKKSSAPAKKTAAKSGSKTATKGGAKKTAAKKSAPLKKSAAKKSSPAKKTAAKKTTAKR